MGEEAEQDMVTAAARIVQGLARMARRRTLGGLMLVGFALAGCSETYPAYPIVPALLAERVPAPPTSDTALSWRPGYYDFSDGNYIWRPGQWVSLAGHGTLWQDGYWVRSGIATYRWVSAGWK